MNRRLVRLGALAAVAVLTLSGCKFQGAASVPLPGGVRGDWEVTVHFKDVLDLVPQSAVKVNDVTVGSVRKIELEHGYNAKVTIRIKNSVKLPSNTTARLRQTSLLGEKFVSLERPDAPVGDLRTNHDITDTDENADIEEVLGALSLVLNGGSLEQLQVINTELTKTLKGRESQVKDFLHQLDTFVAGLDAQKVQITNALDGLDRLTGKLAAQKQVLDVALRDLPKGAAVLADERAQLTKVLAGINNLGTVATRVIQNTQANTVTDLRALQPILTQLAAAGQALPDSLELLTTYPFPKTIGPSTYKGKKVPGGIQGDYANLFISVDADIVNTIGNLGIPLPLPKSGTTGKTPTVPNVPKLPVPSLPKIPGALQGLTDRIRTGSQSDLELLLFGGLA
jgi:phospholipid/cholesterol/gamma-HCH transport system substrate-binding protein